MMSGPAQGAPGSNLSLVIVRACPRSLQNRVDRVLGEAGFDTHGSQKLDGSCEDADLALALSSMEADAWLIAYQVRRDAAGELVDGLTLAQYLVDTVSAQEPAILMPVSHLGMAALTGRLHNKSEQPLSPQLAARLLFLPEGELGAREMVERVRRHVTQLEVGEPASGRKLPRQATPRFFCVPTEWNSVRELRRKVSESLADCSPELVDSTAMVASELCENVCKYGAQGKCRAPEVAVEILETAILVRSENSVDDDAHAERALAVAARIRDHEDRTALYAEAIEKGLSESRASQLGLYRIAAVAGFDIEVLYLGGRLVVAARRAIPSLGRSPGT